MHKHIRALDGANMDIDLTTAEGDVSWKQEKCPWNESENANVHKCAVKNTSICEYFCGISYLDNVLCCHPHNNPLKGSE